MVGCHYGWYEQGCGLVRITKVRKTVVTEDYYDGLLTKDSWLKEKHGLVELFPYMDKNGHIRDILRIVIQGRDEIINMCAGRTV